MWKHTAEPELPQMSMWWVHNACWVIRVTDTYLEYVILSRQQWLHKCASILRSYVKDSRSVALFSTITWMRISKLYKNYNYSTCLCWLLWQNTICIAAYFISALTLASFFLSSIRCTEVIYPTNSETTACAAEPKEMFHCNPRLRKQQVWLWWYITSTGCINISVVSSLSWAK